MISMFNNLVRAASRLLKLVWAGPRLCKVVPAAFSLYSGQAGLSLAVAALAQLTSATVVAAVATDMCALTTLSVVAAVLARDVHSSPSAGLIVAICLSQRQCLCLRHILLRRGWL